MTPIHVLILPRNRKYTRIQSVPLLEYRTRHLEPYHELSICFVKHPPSGSASAGVVGYVLTCGVGR